MKLDDWQRQVLETKGNICLVSGRQVGKSFIISIKAAKYVLENPNKTVLIIAATERQAYLLFEKTLSFIEHVDKKALKSGRYRPTKTELKLKNGSRIYCLPVGQSGYGIRGYTIDQLYVDEASFIPEDVWLAVTPMLATTKGDLILLSTPHGRKGYFYEASKRDDFTQFRLSSEECERIDKEFLKAEQSRMTKKQYAQEYLGHFIDELDQFFPDELIKRCMTAKREQPNINSKYYMGVDIARMGSDESTFEILKRTDDKLIQVENYVTTKTLTTHTTKIIKDFTKKFYLIKIYIDSRGIGAGVLDQLLEDEETRRKVIPIDNAAKDLIYNPDKPRKRKTNKEELYMNLLRLMEQKKIVLLDDDDIFLSLKSVQYEYKDNGEVVIYGKYTHIAEGLIRAAWSIKEKNLSIWISSIRL